MAYELQIRSLAHLRCKQPPEAFTDIALDKKNFVLKAPKL